MTESSITQYGSRDEIKELANRLQKMMPGASRFTESEALTVAQVAISHGLDPFNGEVWGIKYQKNGEWVWAGVMVGVKGLRKSARRQGNYWTEFRRVEPATYNAPASAVVWECHLRDTERVQAYGKSINTLTTSGVPYVEAIKMLGAAPVYIGVGIATPDEHSKMGLHARAKKRAEADAIKQAYDVQFGGAMMENGSVIDGEVSVLGFDDDHALQAGDAEPRPAEQVLEELGYETEPDPEDMLYDVDHYEIEDDGKVIIGGAVIGDAPQQPAQEKTNGGSSNIDDLYQAVINAGLAENTFSAKGALGKCKTGWDTPEKAIAWMRIYRAWRDSGVEAKQAADHANNGKLPQ